MDEELIYQYPIQDENREGSNAEIERLMKTKANVLFKTRVVFTSIALLIAVLFIFSEANRAIPIIIMVLFVVLFMFGKVISGDNNRLDYYTEISAYETYIEIRQTDLSKGKVEQAKIYYDDIDWSIMSRSLERIQICFYQNQSEYYTYSLSHGEFDEVLSDYCLIDIPLNSYTYQQYYFLYVAGDYFNIRIPKTIKNERFILKKYGNSDDYLKKIK